MSDFSLKIKQSVNGDEYYSPQNVVDMIVPYVRRGGGNTYGVRSTKKTACSYRHLKK